MAMLSNLCLIFFVVALVDRSMSHTEVHDVIALEELYVQLNSPPQLKGWRLNASPCDESWLGVSCSGSSVRSIKIQSLNLTGYLGDQLSSLNSLKEFDASFNQISGALPSNLPNDVVRVNLAFNKLTSNLPDTLSALINLKLLNLSHNALSGQIADVFNGLQNLREMDLSFNKFEGPLPPSIATLTSVTTLCLEDNILTGSVILLAVLPLNFLNLQSNNFSGVLPYQFRYIPNLWLEGNNLQAGANDPPWNFPTMENVTQKAKSVHHSEGETMHILRCRHGGAKSFNCTENGERVNYVRKEEEANSNWIDQVRRRGRARN